MKAFEATYLLFETLHAAYQIHLQCWGSKFA
jgi:hypothetical protein